MSFSSPDSKAKELKWWWFFGILWQWLGVVLYTMWMSILKLGYRVKLGNLLRGILDKLILTVSIRRHKPQYPGEIWEESEMYCLHGKYGLTLTMTTHKVIIQIWSACHSCHFKIWKWRTLKIVLYMIKPLLFWLRSWMTFKCHKQTPQSLEEQLKWPTSDGCFGCSAMYLPCNLAGNSNHFWKSKMVRTLDVTHGYPKLAFFPIFWCWSSSWFTEEVQKWKCEKRC